HSKWSSQAWRRGLNYSVNAFVSGSIPAVQRLAKSQLTANFSTGHVSAASKGNQTPKPGGTSFEQHPSYKGSLRRLSLKPSCLRVSVTALDCGNGLHIQEPWAVWFSLKIDNEFFSNEILHKSK